MIRESVPEAGAWRAGDTLPQAVRAGRAILSLAVAGQGELYRVSSLTSSIGAG